MEVFVFARFHVRSGFEDAALEALETVLGPSREEAGCLDMHQFRSSADPRLFYIHSKWKDEAAFDLHATLAHTIRFLTQMEKLTDQPREVARTLMIR